MPQLDWCIHPALGLYQHYKGAYVHLVQVVKHSETEELLAVYYHHPGEWYARPLHGPGGWLTPVVLDEPFRDERRYCDPVELWHAAGHKIERFKWVSTPGTHDPPTGGIISPVQAPR